MPMLSTPKFRGANSHRAATYSLTRRATACWACCTHKSSVLQRSGVLPKVFCPQLTPAFPVALRWPTGALRWCEPDQGSAPRDAEWSRPMGAKSQSPNVPSKLGRPFLVPIDGRPLRRRL